jgi:hypothetical protein
MAEAALCASMNVDDKSKENGSPQRENEIGQRWEHDATARRQSRHLEFMLAQEQNAFNNLEFFKLLRLHASTCHLRLCKISSLRSQLKGWNTGPPSSDAGAFFRNREIMPGKPKKGYLTGTVQVRARD